MFFHFCTFHYWIYYSSRVAIEAALKEDFGEVTSSGSDSPVLLHTDSRTSRRKNTRRRILKSSSSGSDDENHRPSNPCESSVSYTSNTGLRCRPLTLTVTIDDVEETQSVFPSTSRPRRAVVRSAEERRERNRRLIERRQRRRQQPPLVILGADSSTDEDEEANKKRAQEKSDYQLALKLAEEWSKKVYISVAPNIYILEEINASDQNLSCNLDRSRLDCDGRQCIICFEVPKRPVGCIHCRQMIGCEACILKWRRTTNISRLNRSSPLSRGISSANHRSCPLCRFEWEDAPEVAPWEELLC
ncbi:unnamed protein product [Enterobius vermicularis]|uniref:RING-type domain-containing protein n=1 Tax=Enterobius vermicularis TaxID=51028 RepID=A0A0N4V2W4_ENTVE|nr:unnamed protein product [Enterobius vermicularis]